MIIPFNQPYFHGREIEFLKSAINKGKLSGDGFFTKQCEQWLEKQIGSPRALLTPSGTAALEMAAICAEFEPGDEVIMPSYTFPSSANAVVLRGCKPVFVDIRRDTLNIDETLIENAVSKRTKAILVVHYAGVSCEMNEIMRIAKKFNLLVIEDAAQAIMSSYEGKKLGTIGDFGCFSFHETKNISSGEGGAFLVKNLSHISRAEIVREKGTDRSQFLRGEIDKYSWRDVGSSYIPNELTAAFLLSQLEKAKKITEHRVCIWNKYDSLLRNNGEEHYHCPKVPENCVHNGHSYFLLCKDPKRRDRLIDRIKQQGVHCSSHYLPLHDTDFGMKSSNFRGFDDNTSFAAKAIIRMPVWVGIEPKVEQICEKILKCFSE